MNAKDFALTLSITRMPADSATARAARLCLVDGYSANAAAKALHIDHAAVSRACKRLRSIASRGLCPTCGQPLVVRS